MRNRSDEEKDQEKPVVKLTTVSERKTVEHSAKLGIALNVLSAAFAIINGLILLPMIIACLEHNTAVLGWYWPVFLLVIFSILPVPVLLVIDERVIKRLNATLTEEQPHHILAGGCLSLLFMHLFLSVIALIVPLEFFEVRVDTLPFSVILFVLCLAIIVAIVFGCIMAYKGKDFRGRRKIVSLLAKLLFIANLFLAALTIVDILIAVLVFVGVGRH